MGAGWIISRNPPKRPPASVLGLFAAVAVDGAYPAALERSIPQYHHPASEVAQSIANARCRTQEISAIKVLVVTASPSRLEGRAARPFSITYKTATNARPGHHGLHSVIQDGYATGHGVISSSVSPRIPVGRMDVLGVAWKSQTAATATEHRARSEYLWSTC
jgi:hypothetical protein